MNIIRFRQKSNMNVVAVYRKGKNSKLTVDSIRLLVESPEWSYITGQYQLMVPEIPRTDLLEDMKDSLCLISGIKMSERPEFMGDILPLKAFDIDVNHLPSVLRQKGRNYYLCNESDSKEAMAILQNALPCVE